MNAVMQIMAGWTPAYFLFCQLLRSELYGLLCVGVINDDVIEAGQGFGTHPHKIWKF